MPARTTATPARSARTVYDFSLLGNGPPWDQRESWRTTYAARARTRATAGHQRLRMLQSVLDATSWTRGAAISEKGGRGRRSWPDSRRVANVTVTIATVAHTASRRWTGESPHDRRPGPIR